MAKTFRIRWRSVFQGALIFGLFLFATSIVTADEYTDPVPLNGQSKSTKAALKKMAACLARVHPDKMRGLRSFETTDGIYVLYGDLFRTGHIFALAALSGGGKPYVQPDTESSDSSVDNSGPSIGLGFAEWTGTTWEPRDLWRIHPIWRPKEWKESDIDYLPKTPATKPFWTKFMGGDGRPEVVVAGEVDKYFQEHYLLRFAPKTHALIFVASAMAEPEFVDGWVRLSDNSGRRAIWEEWTYLRWEGDKLVPKASWHDETPYDDSEKPFVRATRFDGKGGTQSFMFDAEGADDCAITRDGQPFAEMKFQFRRAPGTDPHAMFASADAAATAASSESAYLFEKLTGVPRKLHVLPRGAAAPVRLEKLATVRVTGSKEAVRMLSPGE